MWSSLWKQDENGHDRIDAMSTRLDTEQCVTRRLTNGKSQSKVNNKTESRKTIGRRIKTEINEKQNQSVIKHLLWGGWRGGGGLKRFYACATLAQCSVVSGSETLHNYLRLHWVVLDKFYLYGASPIKLCEPRHDKTNKVTVRPAKTQISLGIRPVWSESSLDAQSLCWFCHVRDWQNQQSDCAPSEDSDQPGHPPSLIRVFAGCTVTLLVLSCRGSCPFFKLCLTTSFQNHLNLH